MDVPETRYAKSGNVHVAYCIRGEGPVDLVFIPGWISNIELMWEDRWMRAWLDRMATFSRLIAFDKRGTGLSDRVTDDLLPDLETRMDDVRAVMDAAPPRIPARVPPRSFRGWSARRAVCHDLSSADRRRCVLQLRRPGCLGPGSPLRDDTRVVRARAGSGRARVGRRNLREIVYGGPCSLPGQGRGLPRLAGQVRPAERKPERRHRHRPYVVGDRCPSHCAVAWRPEPGPLASRRRLCGREPIPRRARAIAGPDEVLVTSTVRDLVAGSGLVFQPRGEHELRGAGTWTLFAVNG